jgi:branched-chain amino acid transport system substrate-binding protein
METRRRFVASLFVAVSWVVVLGVGCEKRSAPAAEKPAPSQPAPVTDELLVGFVGPLTGPIAPAGISNQRGVELAIKEANAAGGVNGKPVRLRVYDDQGKPEEAGTAAIRLINQDRVKLILADMTSSGSLVIADKAQPAGIPQIASTATAREVTEKGDFIFRVCFIDPFQGAVMARFARENLGLRRVAILQDSKNTYSLGLSEAFSRAFSALGGEIVATEAFSQGDTDFRAPLTAIKASRPEAIYLPVYGNDAGVVLRQARQLALKMPVLGADAWDSPKLFEFAGASVDGSYFTSHFAVDDTSPRGRRFADAFLAAYGEAPDSFAALGYDSALLAVDALRRARDLSGPAIRDALAATRDFPGVTGTLSFDAHRNPVKPVVVKRAKGGAFEFVASIKP